MNIFTNDEVMDIKRRDKKVWYINQQSCGVLRNYPLNWFEVDPDPKIQEKLYIKRVIGVAYTKPERLCFMEGEMDAIN